MSGIAADFQPCGLSHHSAVRVFGRPEHRIVINVGGVRFETYKSTLANMPDTRLAWAMQSHNLNPDYDPVRKEYFFDRNPNIFVMILNYYRTGHLHCPADTCGPLFESELNYWGIDEKQIQPCCWGVYSKHRNAQKTLAEMKMTPASPPDGEDDLENSASQLGIVDGSAKPSKWSKYKKYVWGILDDPFSSRPAKVYTAISMVFLILAITTLCLESHPSFRMLADGIYKTEKNWTTQEFREKTRPLKQLTYIDDACIVFFTIELIARFIFAPSIMGLLKTFLIWIDIFSIVPFYMMLIIESANTSIDHGMIELLGATRLIRIFRVFKAAQHLDGMRILFHTLKASAKELALTGTLISLMVLIFATLIYYAEMIGEDPDNNFVSIPIGFWWAAVTMTTLGYGDKVPKTAAGYFVGCICAICGVLVIALPIPIIVNNFAIYYSHAKAQAKLPLRKCNTTFSINNDLKRSSDSDRKKKDNCNCDVGSDTEVTEITDGPIGLARRHLDFDTTNSASRKSSIVSSQTSDWDVHMGSHRYPTGLYPGGEDKFKALPVTRPHSIHAGPINIEENI